MTDNRLTEGMLLSLRDTNVVKSQTETLPPYEANRLKVAEFTREIVLQADSDVAKTIGFEGRILDEVSNNRDHTLGINNAKIADPLKQCVNGSRFTYADLNLRYTIDCYDNSCSPEIEFSNNDGTTTKMWVSTGSDKNTAFDRATLTKSRQTRSGDLKQSKEIRTYVTNSHPGEPDYPLQISQRIGEYIISTVYVNPDQDGNVKLLDGQRINVRSTNPNTPPKSGVYLGKIGIVKWDHSENESYPLTDSTLDIKVGEDTFSFPTTTNIYNELKNMVANKNQLSDVV